MFVYKFKLSIFFYNLHKMIIENININIAVKANKLI